MDGGQLARWVLATRFSLGVRDVGCRVARAAFRVFDLGSRLASAYNVGRGVWGAGCNVGCRVSGVGCRV